METAKKHNNTGVRQLQIANILEQKIRVSVVFCVCLCCLCSVRAFCLNRLGLVWSIFLLS
jgi:hypothetical protein